MITRPDIEQVLKLSDLYLRIRKDNGAVYAEIGPQQNYVKTGTVVSELPHSIKLLLDEIDLDATRLSNGYDATYKPLIDGISMNGSEFVVSGGLGSRLNSVFPAKGHNLGGSSFSGYARRIITSPLSRDVEPDFF